MKPRALIQNLALPIALAAIAAFFAWQADFRRDDAGALLWQPVFLSPRNLTELLVEFAIIGTLSLGMFMVILTGHIDLSVGSGVGLVGGIAAVLAVQHAWPAAAALAAAFACAVALWALMGTLIVVERIPSFIVTLGGLLIFKGLFWRVIASATVPVSRGDQDNAYSLLTTYHLPAAHGLALGAAVLIALGLLAWHSRRARRAHGLPVRAAGAEVAGWAGAAAAVLGVVSVCNLNRGVPLTLLVLAATAGAVYFITKHTPFGRYLYAIGGNEEAAHLSGIPITRIMIGAYVLMGVAVALTGFMTTAYAGASTTTVGELMELDAIAACVIGGTALKGGRGTVGGVLLGALIMTTLLNGMTLLSVEPEIKFIARGVVLALAVWMDVKLRR